MKKTYFHEPRIRAYIIGFLISLLLTVTAYFLATTSIGINMSDNERNYLVFLLLSLAFLQYVAQAYWFFHLGDTSKKWDLRLFIIMSGLVSIIVLGSIWIMNNLNYNMMGNSHIEKEIITDELPTKPNTSPHHGNH